MIQVVCEQSQVDFEEGGVDESTLKLLKSVCLHLFLSHHFRVPFLLLHRCRLRNSSYGIRSELDDDQLVQARHVKNGGELIDSEVTRVGARSECTFGGKPTDIMHFYTRRCLNCTSPRYAKWGCAVHLPL